MKYVGAPFLAFIALTSTTSAFVPVAVTTTRAADAYQRKAEEYKKSAGEKKNVPNIYNRRVDTSLLAKSVDDNDDDENDTTSITPPPPVTIEESSPEQQQQQQRQPTIVLSTTDALAALGTSPRRILLSMISATGIALAGNLFGVTSALLSIVPDDTVESSGLDVYFPRGEYKRCLESDYTFVFPKEWVADTFVALAKAQRQTRSLDLDMKRGRSGGTTTTTLLPDVAFGPPGRLDQTTGTSASAGDVNVSVIRTTGLPESFSLRGTLGDPTTAAETLFQLSLAPPGSGRIATLIEADEITTRPGDDDDGPLYQFSYVVDRGSRGPPLRAVSVVGVKQPSTLITLTVVAPVETWDRSASKFQKVSDSFHLR